MFKLGAEVLEAHLHGGTTSSDPVFRVPKVETIVGDFSHVGVIVITTVLWFCCQCSESSRCHCGCRLCGMAGFSQIIVTVKRNCFMG